MGAAPLLAASEHPGVGLRLVELGKLQVDFFQKCHIFFAVGDHPLHRPTQDADRPIRRPRRSIRKMP
jgi:hypothetical protein